MAELVDALDSSLQLVCFVFFRIFKHALQIHKRRTTSCGSCLTRQEHWVARREISGVELVKFGERFSGDINADTELSLFNGEKESVET